MTLTQFETKLQELINEYYRAHGFKNALTAYKEAGRIRMLGDNMQADVLERDIEKIESDIKEAFQNAIY